MCKETIPQRECGVVIIGAGLEALSIVSRLPPSVLQNATVIDPSGEWLHSWNAHCQKLGVTHLRLPITQHPGASPLELRSFIEQQGLEKELLEVIPGHSPVPSAALLLKFCEERVISKLPNSVKNIIKDTVVDVQPIYNAEEIKNKEEEDETETEDDGTRAVLDEEDEQSPQPSCMVHLASGRILPARAVIVTCSRCAPVVPTWARDAMVNEVGQHEEKVNEISQISQISTDVASKPHKKINTWDQIDFTNSEFQEQNIKGKRIVIVGGGMTAALLALGAISREGKGPATAITIIARRPLIQQPFNCDIGWWGNKYLNAFWQEPDPEYRMKMCRQARHQASITPHVWAALENAVDSGEIKIMQGYQVDKATLKSSGNQSLELKLTPTPNIDTSKSSLFVGSSTSSSGSPTSPTATSASCVSSIEADCVWLACGSAYNAALQPLLCTIQSKLPTRIVAGYPVLDPASCVWPGAPVYIVGRGALLAVGPCAGELVGIRLAADRIVKSLKKLDYSGKTEWEIAAEILLPHLKTAPGAAPRTPPPEINLNKGVNSTLQPRIVLENYLELEEHGIMCYIRHIKPSVSHPPHLIDISDLPPASELPRHEIQKFSFSEDDFEISVVLQLPEAVTLASVRSLITERSLEVWAVGNDGMYRLHVPRLYGKVLPSRCKIKVNESRMKVYVVLHKEKDAEWRFLKGF
ncbi:hypothetical protein NADE_005116 [Nannochloris sp. 'desiccata']|nr:hypothetical protein KSW81_001980 [Chlorella desiccata (nom. nud.)]KAH7622531.1 hypothetical protein NADE_005116 [Chlorella desiccata (nom. nud.)]